MALQKKARKTTTQGDVKKAITIKKKEIVVKYESGIYAIDLANMYNMLKSTISTVLQRDLCKEHSVGNMTFQLSLWLMTWESTGLQVGSGDVEKLGG